MIPDTRYCRLTDFPSLIIPSKCRYPRFGERFDHFPVAVRLDAPTYSAFQHVSCNQTPPPPLPPPLLGVFSLSRWSWTGMTSFAMGSEISWVEHVGRVPYSTRGAGCAMQKMRCVGRGKGTSQDYHPRIAKPAI